MLGDLSTLQLVWQSDGLVLLPQLYYSLKYLIISVPFTLSSIPVWKMNHMVTLPVPLYPGWSLVAPSSFLLPGSLLEGSGHFSPRSRVRKLQPTELWMVFTFFKNGINKEYVTVYEPWIAHEFVGDRISFILFLYPWQQLIQGLTQQRSTINIVWMKKINDN